MAVTFRHTASGDLVSVPEPGDGPERLDYRFARRLAQFDQADEWVRADPVGDVAPGAGRPSAAEIRVWARAAGIDVPERGKLPAAVVDAWLAAHGDRADG